MELATEKTYNSTAVTALLFLGKVSHSWKFKLDGQEIEILFEVGEVEVEEEVEKRCSGFDATTRAYLYEVLSVGYALRAVGGYAFKNTDERMKFVRGLQPPVLNLFIGELRTARLRQVQLVKEAVTRMGESQPTQPTAPAGA